MYVTSQILLYIFYNQMYPSYNNRIENKAFKRTLYWAKLTGEEAYLETDKVSSVLSLS